MAKYPKRLSAQNKKEIIKRRGGDSDKSGKKGDLEIHHTDRNPNNNNPRNLRVLTKKEHKDVHAKS
ncbi:MAG: HNH endonuclease [Chloroflexi bacterium]|nr:HNH endonuclease [Chloroflexota bacterium]